MSLDSWLSQKHDEIDYYFADIEETQYWQITSFSLVESERRFVRHRQVFSGQHCRSDESVLHSTFSFFSSEENRVRSVEGQVAWDSLN